MKTIECRYCDCKVPYVPSANIIVFCPKCKSCIYAECEYGYGPVTPCCIYLGEEVIGTVCVDNKNQYFLQIESSRKKIKLKKRYSEALQEATQIVRKEILLKKDKKHWKRLKIKKETGSLCFYNDWFGRPMDNMHRIKKYSYENNVLKIVFDKEECLVVLEPTEIINTTKEFAIHQAKKVKWFWYPYGDKKKEMKEITYELKDGKVYKNGKCEEMVFEVKEPCFSVRFI